MAMVGASMQRKTISRESKVKKRKGKWHQGEKREKEREEKERDTTDRNKKRGQHFVEKQSGTYEGYNSSKKRCDRAFESRGK